MGRGSQDQRDLSKQQLSADQLQVQNAQQEREAGRNALMPQINDLITKGGYSDADKASISGNAIDATNASYDTGAGEMTSAAARTRNSAGLEGGIASLARDRAGTLAGVNRGVQQSFADKAIQQKNMGQQMLANVYGIDTNLFGGIAGLPQGDLAQHAKGISPGFGEILGQGLQGAGAVAGGWLAGR